MKYLACDPEIIRGKQEILSSTNLIVSWCWVIGHEFTVAPQPERREVSHLSARELSRGAIPRTRYLSLKKLLTIR